MGIDPEVEDDDLDVAEPRPARVDLAGGVFEAVGGGVIGSIRVGAGEPGHGVRGGLPVREPGPVPPLAIDRDVAEPPAVLQPGKVGDPLPARASRRLPARDGSAAADDDPALVSGRSGVDGGALGGARVLGIEDQWLGQVRNGPHGGGPRRALRAGWSDGSGGQHPGLARSWQTGRRCPRRWAIASVPDQLSRPFGPTWNIAEAPAWSSA